MGLGDEVGFGEGTEGGGAYLPAGQIATLGGVPPHAQHTSDEGKPRRAHEGADVMASGGGYHANAEKCTQKEKKWEICGNFVNG